MCIFEPAKYMLRVFVFEPAKNKVICSKPANEEKKRESTPAGQIMNPQSTAFFLCNGESVSGGSYN